MKIISEHFDDMMLDEQDCLGNESQVKQFLLMISDEQLRNKLETEMLKQRNSTDRWRVFQDTGINTKKVIGLSISTSIIFIYLSRPFRS